MQKNQQENLKSTSALNAKVSCYNKQHYNQQALFLCLNKYCQNKRLICRVCLKEDHYDHQHTMFDFKNRHSKINNLRVNSNYNKMRKSQQICVSIQRERVNQLFEQILQTPQILLEKISSIVKNLRSIRHIILQSFDCQLAVSQFHQILAIKDPKLRSEKLQRIVETINLFQNKYYLKIGTKINKALQKMLFQIKQFSSSCFKQKETSLSDQFQSFSKRVQKWSLFRDKQWDINQQEFQSLKVQEKIQPQNLHHSRLHQQGIQKHISRVAKQRKWTTISDWIQEGNQLKDLILLNITCKQIKVIEPIMLQPFPYLKHLNLQGNCIKKIQNLHLVPTLEILNLTYNCIQKIQNLDCLGQLKQLRLGQNHIEIIENLHSLQKMHTLSLYRNRISHLSTQLLLLNELKFLSLQSNYLDRNNRKDQQIVKKLYQKQVNVKL